MKRSRGFTLIEVMVAVAVAAVLAVMAFGAMRQALDNRERIRTNGARVTALQATIRTLVQDFSQLEPRPVREPVGDGYQPALLGTPGDNAQVMLTRAGWSNPAGVARSTLQRVRYQLRDGALYRDHWLVLDALLQPEPVARRMLDGVRGFRLRYMNEARQWQQEWPAAGPNVGGASGERALRWRPIAVEVTLELEDWGTITRLVEVAG
jgi:general secretion pathway protein J